MRESLSEFLGRGGEITRLPPVCSDPEAAIARVRGLRDLARMIPKAAKCKPRGSKVARGKRREA